MEIRVSLQYDYGYSWTSGNGISVKGFVYNDQNEILDGIDLLSFFEGIETEEAFRQKLEEANGLFSVIIRKENCVFFAVDRTRTFPLFYSLKQEIITISDAADLAVPGHLQLSGAAKEEFLFTGYVTGSGTLLSGVSQVQAGEYIVYEKKLSARYYHWYVADKVIEEPFETLAVQLADVFDAVGKRMVQALKGRTAVIPLSGGYDSRLLAVLLRKNNYPKVICFTYGIPSSPDVLLSEKVARQLGFPWHFVPYTTGTIGDFLDTAEFNAYVPFAANYTSMFFTQDYFAIRYLKQKEIVPEDAVIIPGHTGDFIAGGHLVPGLTEETVAPAILKRHYTLKKGNKDVFLSRIAMLKAAKPFESFEHWNLKERQAKFIINSNRNYEFWGFEHLIPLWDKELVQFFQNVGLEHKTGRKLFDYVLFRYYFAPWQVAFYKEKYPLVIRKIVGARNRLRRAIFSDHYNFKLIARHFLNHAAIGVAWSSRDININSIQTAWYIALLRQKGIEEALGK